MSKMSLTEATILALQGKLTEDVEVETPEVEVTVGEEKTIIDTQDSTVTVEKNEEASISEEPIVDTEEEVLPVEDVDTNVDTNVDTMVDDKPVESEVEDTVEEITESKKLQEDDDDDDEESEETTEEEVVEEVPESEEAETEPVEDQLSAIDEAVSKIKDMINALPEEVKSEIFKCEDCTDEKVTDEVPEVEETTEEEVVEEPVDELEECDKFNSATFNEVLTKYYNKQNKKVEKFELTKLLKNKNTLKVEGKLINSDKTTKDIKLEMKQVQRGTKFGRYEVKTDKKVESVRGKQIMMVSASNKVLNCNYMINKK